MATYTYRGPMSAATLPDGREVILIDGQTVDLPEDNAWVKVLVARGHLAPAGGGKAARQSADINATKGD